MGHICYKFIIQFLDGVAQAYIVEGYEEAGVSLI